MACRLTSAKPLSETMLEYCLLDIYEQTSVKFWSQFIHFHSGKCIWKCRLKWRPFCVGLNVLNASLSLNNEIPWHKNNGLSLFQKEFWRCSYNLKCVISKFILEMKMLSSSCRITLCWIPHNLTDVKSTLIQVTAWCQHDDVIKWKHFLRHWPFVRGIHQSAVNSPHKGQWYGALIFSLICARTNGWANHLDASDLRCHHTHYDVTVMTSNKLSLEAILTKFSDAMLSITRWQGTDATLGVDTMTFGAEFSTIWWSCLMKI